MKLLREGEMDRRNGQFEVLTSGPNIQIASMVLQPGEDSGEYGNEHPKSDQVLYVVSGSGEATVNGEIIQLRDRDLLLIEAGEDHQIRCTGKAELRTINYYSPPAY